MFDFFRLLYNNKRDMAEVFLDAFTDSLKLLLVVAVFTYIIALIEPKLSDKVRLKGKFAPLIGVSLSMLPQCGFSVVATDLYHKRHITLGTLIGVYLATSDEALPVFLTYPKMALHILPILAAKFALGLIFGYLIDIIYKKGARSVQHHISHCEDEYKITLMEYEGTQLVEKCSHGAGNDCNCEDCIKSDCPHLHSHCTSDHCEHDLSGKGILFYQHQKALKNKAKRANIKRFAIKPLLHSIEIFLYVFIVNIIFGIILYYIGEERLVSFLTSNKYTAPLLAVMVGAIPNCVSSIVLSELYIMGGLGFGATLGGLCINAGVAFLYLFKDAKHTKQNIAVFSLMFLLSVFIAYIFSLPFSFDTLPI